MSRAHHEPPSYLGSFLYSWMYKPVRESKVQDLDLNELYMPSDQNAEPSYDAFAEKWEEEVAHAQKGGKKKPSLIRALWRTYKFTYCLAGICKFMWSVFVITGAFYFVRSMLEHVNQKPKGSVYLTETAGWCLAIFFFVDSWLLGLALQRMTYLALRCGLKAKAALTNAVCRKAFRQASVNQETSSLIVSFVATDIMKIYEGMLELHYLWTAPLEAIAILALLAYLVKEWMLPGLGVIALIVPLQYWFGYKIIQFKNESSKLIRGRSAMFQELLPAIKLVKYYAWEKFFCRLISEKRAEEIKIMIKLCAMKTFNIAMVFNTPPLTAFVIFCAYEFNSGARLDSTIAFTTLSLFNILRFPLVVLPKALRAASEAYAAAVRVETYLLAKDEDDGATSVAYVNRPGVDIEGCKFTYPGKETFTLNVPRFSVERGEVVAVVGRVGVGKSSLFNAILGNMIKTNNNGRCEVGGRISYVPQNPWCQNLSLRDSIVFGENFDQSRYDDVIHACALTLDLEILAQGDQSMAGLRGINLSGGQRQRLNLARCAYAPAELVLLDNALSAVDHHTAQHIFEHCIKGLFRDKAVILATHQLEFLPKCDRVAIVNDGNVEYFGPWNAHAQTLLGKLLPVSHLLHAAGGAEGPRDPPKKEAKKSFSTQKTTVSLAPTGLNAPKDKKKHEMTFQKSLNKWILKGGVFLFIINVFLFMIAQAARQVSDVWVRQWANDGKDNAPYFLNSLYAEDEYNASLTYSLVYMGMMLFFFISMLFRGVTFYLFHNGAAQRLHMSAVTKVMYAPMVFFLNTPIGDLLLNFTKDQDTMDEALPDTMHFLGIYGVILVATIATVSVTIPYFAAFGGALIIFTFIMLHLYLPAATRLKKLKGDSAGAVVTLVAETLEGLNVVHAFKKQDHFVKEACRRVDLANVALFNTDCLNLWLAFYCDFAGAILVLGVSIFAVTLKTDLGGAAVGLAFSNTIQMLVFYTWVVRYIADTISLWNSVEKVAWIDEFAPKDGTAANTDEGVDPKAKVLDPAADDETVNSDMVIIMDGPDAGKSIGQWPTKGLIRFENVWMQYKPGCPFALKGVTFTIQPRDKVGVVGRTGSGKSTLLLALYRMFEISKGEIIIDGVNVAHLPVRRLRMGLSIIPQEPVMFSGTVRSNLDPFNQFQDQQLWEVIDKVGLRAQVRDQAGGLDGRVDGTGGNAWSLGQQQLVCLARAALRAVPILCLDEATAAMDPHTEQLVQETIKRIFEDRSTITIAHRLDTVIESDKVIVMEAGVLKEMDHPKNLLDNPESMFSKLVDRTGAAGAAALRQIAAEHFARGKH